MTAGAVPVPVKETFCGLPLALSVTIRVPDRLPVAVGVKVTLKVQLAPGATLTPQVFVCAKSVLLAPVMAMLRVSGALPLFDSVTACGALVVPTFWLPNESEVSESVTTGT